jgi:GAF domain-containing protein
MDQKPRVFTDNEISLLKDLASWAEIELNSNQLREAIEEATIAHEQTQVQLNQLKQMNELMVGRELKMTELKAELAELKSQIASIS